MIDETLLRWMLVAVALRVVTARVGEVPLPRVSRAVGWWVLVGLVWWSVGVS